MTSVGFRADKWFLCWTLLDKVGLYRKGGDTQSINRSAAHSTCLTTASTLSR